MIGYKGTFFPEGETHLIDWFETVFKRKDCAHHEPIRHGDLVYQGAKYDMALRSVKRRRVAVDIGAHIGLWSRIMAKDFLVVHAFEPVPEYQKCWRANMRNSPNALLYDYAMSDSVGEVAMHCRTKGSSGDTSVAVGDQEPNAAHRVPKQRLDHYNLQDVDFIKVDNEGYEFFALTGAIETLKRCKPCVIVEQKPDMAQRFGLRETQAVELLQSLGAKLVREMGGDFILKWD